MDTTLSAAREYILNDRAWASPGKTLDRKVNTCILRALRELSGEVPEALVPEDFHTRVFASVTSTAADVSATISATDDLKVMSFTIAGSSTWAPAVDGTWNGLMHIIITDPNGRERRRQSREWWTSGGVYYVSLDRPWRNATDVTMDFIIYQPEFFLPANTTTVLMPMRLFDESEQQVGLISSGTARRLDLPDYKHTSSGQPSDAWRGQFFQMPAPTVAPTVTSVLKDNTASDIGPTSYLSWAGPVQEGKFEFCFTYAWGRAEQEWGDTQGAFSHPVWESAPSPVSEVFDHLVESDVYVDGTTRGRAINIQCSNIEEMLDFMGDPNGVQADAATYPPATAPKRYGRSGVKIRVYVRRLAIYEKHGPATTVTGVSTPSIIQATHRTNRAEADGKFYLLAELDPLDLDKDLSNALLMTTRQFKVSSFTWRGAPFNTTGATPQYNLPPDTSMQLRKSTGYYAYHLWPMPDKDYDLDISLLRQPKELVNDNDTLPLKQEAFAAFLELALAYMSRLDGVDTQSEMKHRAVFKQLVRRFRAQHGDNKGIVENQPWEVDAFREQYTAFSEG